MAQLLFADHVSRGLVGKDQSLAARFPRARQFAQDGQKRRDAGAAGDEHTGSLVTDGAERLGHQQFGARLQLVQRLGDAGVVGISLDGELEHPVGGQSGGGERPPLFALAGPVDRQLHPLAGNDGKSGWLADDESLHVVGDELAHQQITGVVHRALLLPWNTRPAPRLRLRADRLSDPTSILIGRPAVQKNAGFRLGGG